MIPLLVLSPVVAVTDSERSEIVITASRDPQPRSLTAASVSMLDKEIIDRLGDPLASSLLRLTPSAAIETDGPAGSLTQVRIRGAEANHTLLFIDGIRANDPAAGDIPRFDLLNADIASRIEVVRGPQSALWGSDAIGGVVTVNGLPPETSGYTAAGEAGAFGFARASASAALASSSASLVASGGLQRASGIDSFNGSGDKDGYSNFAGRVRADWTISPGLTVGSSGFSLSGRSEFDGFDPVTFLHSDTLDSTRNRLSAGRVWITGGNPASGLSGTIATSFLGSSNRNFLAEDEINRTSGQRWTVAGQIHYRFTTGPVGQTAILALGHDREAFHASDIIYGGSSDQDRHRSHDSATLEWRGEAGPIVTDLAFRRDNFSGFDGASTVRASTIVTLGFGLSATASYSEGIAQPTFFDLYGFFPGNFAGNPALRPERSNGYEASLRFHSGGIDAALTGYRQRLRGEIVDVFDPVTFQSSTANRGSASRRAGIEAELGWAVGKRMRVAANYAYLHATQPGSVPAIQVREVRRPKHSGSIAIDGKAGRITYGASIAYVGPRDDSNFDVVPAQEVRLHPYLLAGGRIAFQVRPALELFARTSNLFNSIYQDVFGYRTEGRAVYAGFRLGGG